MTLPLTPHDPARLAMARCYHRAEKHGPGRRVSLRRIAESHATFTQHFANYAAIPDTAMLLQTSHVQQNVFEKSGSGDKLQIRKHPEMYRAFLDVRRLTWRRLAMFATARERQLERQDWQCTLDERALRGDAHGIRTRPATRR